MTPPDGQKAASWGQHDFGPGDQGKMWAIGLPELQCKKKKLTSLDNGVAWETGFPLLA